LAFFGAFRGQNLIFKANTALISATGDFFGFLGATALSGMRTVLFMKI
jgi:hypothetical protein